MIQDNRKPPALYCKVPTLHLSISAMYAYASASLTTPLFGIQFAMSWAIYSLRSSIICKVTTVRGDSASRRKLRLHRTREVFVCYADHLALSNKDKKCGHCRSHKS
jgi:hypothetical protein